MQYMHKSFQDPMICKSRSSRFQWNPVADVLKVADSTEKSPSFYGGIPMVFKQLQMAEYHSEG